MDTLIDVLPFEYTLLEDRSPSGNMRVRGVFQRADVLNENKRVYPRAIWERTLNDSSIMESVSARAMFGECDHPADGKTQLKRVSHLITDLEMTDDGTVIGEAEILPTPNGQILQQLFESGARVGISSRGSGSVRNRSDGAKEVCEDFKLSTFDFVARPSTPGALPTPKTTKGKVREEAEEVPSVVPTTAHAEKEHAKARDHFRDVTALNADVLSIAEDITKAGKTFDQDDKRFYESALTDMSGQIIALSNEAPSTPIFCAR